MPADTSPAQQVPPDEAAAIRDLTDHVALLAREHVEMLDRAAALEAAVAKLVEAGAMRPAPVPDGLAELEAHLVADSAPHDAAFERLLNSPVDAIGQLITKGARVAFSSGLGKGLEVGDVAAIADNLVVTIDDGTATPWKRAASRVIVLPAGFGQ